MPTTTNRGYASPSHGGAVDTWDGDLNTIFNQIDQNLGATASIAVSSSNVTLISSEYACGTIRLSGTLGANCLILFPNVSGWWVVENLCTVGAFYVACRLAAGGNQIGMPPGEATDVLADGTNMKYRNLGRVGSYLDLASTTVPAWVTGSTVPPYLNCTGGSFSAVTYPALNAVLGGTTLPDFRGRGAFYMDGATSRITTAGSGIDGATLFAAGGAQNVALSSTHNGPHIHLVNDTGHVHDGQATYNDIAISSIGLANVSGPIAVLSTSSGTVSDFSTVSAITGISLALSGDGTAHNNMPPAVMSGIRLIRAA